MSATPDSPSSTEPSSGGTAPLSSNLKLLALLDLIAETSSPVSASQLAHQIGASRSAVHRQLVTLTAAGWLKNLDNGTYALSLSGVRLGRAALRHSGLDERIGERLSHAARELDELVTLAAIDAGQVTVVERAVPSRAVRVDVSHGDRFPLVGSALGIVLTAHATPKVRESLTNSGIELPDEQTLTAARSDGYASIVDTEFDPIAVIAVPVGHTGAAPYALCAQWPQFRTPKVPPLSVLQPAARDLAELFRQAAGLAAM